MKHGKYGFLLCLALILLPAAAYAAEGGGKPDGEARWSVGTGYFLPNEGDLDASWIVGLKYAYQKGNDIVFADVMFSQTETNVGSGALINAEVNHNIVHLGYMMELQENKHLRLGAALQIHQMDFPVGVKMTRVTPAGVIEYDLSKRLSIRLENSADVKKNQVRFGNTVLAMIQWKL